MNSHSEKTILFALLFIASAVFNLLSAQNISYYKDFNKNENLASVKFLDFEPYTKIINDGLNEAHYWFKIEGLKAEENFIQIKNSHITEVVAFQNDKILEQSSLERFSTFKIINLNTVYLKVEATRESFIPVNTFSALDFHFKEKKQLLIIGLYNGFAIVILLLNLFYFFNFKDHTFLYYFSFLLALTFGLLISDGILKLFSIPSNLIDVIETTNHFLVSITAILFAHSFLQVENYYPKLKYVSIILVVTIGILSICYVSSFNFIYFTLLEILVFIICTMYIITAAFLFDKNDFSKIFLLAYSIILVLGFFYYVNKLLGFTLLDISSNDLKIGAIVEMMVLSFAVVYRMKTLKVENDTIRVDLDNYITEIEALSATVDKHENKNTAKENIELLSFRENEILQLISQGKTNKEIGLDLHISGNTVKFHVKNIYTKLNIKSRKEVSAVINNLDKLQ